jgi:hypothetical protein
LTLTLQVPDDYDLERVQELELRAVFDPPLTFAREPCITSGFHDLMLEVLKELGGKIV